MTRTSSPSPSTARSIRRLSGIKRPLASGPSWLASGPSFDRLPSACEQPSCDNICSCAVEWLSVGGASLPRHRASRLTSPVSFSSSALTKGSMCASQDLIFLNCNRYNDPDSKFARRSTFVKISAYCFSGACTTVRRQGQANPGKPPTASTLVVRANFLTGALLFAVGILARGAHEARGQGDQHLLHRRVHDRAPP